MNNSTMRSIALLEKATAVGNETNVRLNEQTGAHTVMLGSTTYMNSCFVRTNEKNTYDHNRD